MKGGQKDLRGVKFFIVIASLLGLAILPLQAQDRFEDDYLRSTLSMENGLPCNFIDDVCQDDAGFLWLATSGGGLCRFDGYDLLTFSATSGTPLKSNFIRNVCEDRFHRLWIASEGGLDLLDLGTLDRLDLPPGQGAQPLLLPNQGVQSGALHGAVLTGSPCSPESPCTSHRWRR